MSNTHLRPIPTLPPVEATPRYEPADYSLSVGPNGGIPVAMHRLSIGTVTLSFSPDEHVLTGLDAYTNPQRWKRQLTADPPVDKEMALACIEDFDEHGIGPTGSGSVQYIYSHEASLLLIRIDDGHVATRVRCLSCGICGLGTSGELVEIWVQGVVL